jgi:hypothetical protein
MGEKAVGWHSPPGDYAENQRFKGNTKHFPVKKIFDFLSSYAHSVPGPGVFSNSLTLATRRLRLRAVPRGPVWGRQEIGFLLRGVSPPDPPHYDWGWIAVSNLRIPSSPFLRPITGRESGKGEHGVLRRRLPCISSEGSTRAPHFPSRRRKKAPPLATRPIKIPGRHRPAKKGIQ